MSDVAAQIDRIYIACHAGDQRFVRICVASIREWYPAIPIFLIKDELNGPFSTREIETHWDVGVREPAGKYGWGFGKLEPLFDSHRRRVMILDSDIIFVGRVLDVLERHAEDFVVHGEQQNPADFETLYFVEQVVRQRWDPALPKHPDSFNSGQFVANTGILQRDDFAPFVEWSLPPKARHPDVFKQGEQGMLNFVALRREREGTLTIGREWFMRWAQKELAAVDLAALRRGHGDPSLIHFAGMKRRRLGAMPRADLLRYFEARYYSRIPGGQARRHTRAFLTTTSDALRGFSARLKRRLSR